MAMVGLDEWHWTANYYMEVCRSPCFGLIPRYVLGDYWGDGHDTGSTLAFA